MGCRGIAGNGGGWKGGILRPMKDIGEGMG